MANLTTHTNLTSHFNTTLSTNLTSNSTTAGIGPNATIASVRTRSRALPWDNPDNLMSKETSDQITFAFQCYLFPILTVFGITGNVLSMVVMLQKRLRDSTTTIVLVGLAISDILFLATNMVRKSTCIIREFDPQLADAFNAKAFRYAFYLKTAFSRVSTLLVVLISLERLIAVAFPLRVKVVVTKPRVLLAVISCYVFALAGIAGLPFQYTHATVGGRTFIAQTPFALDNVDSLKIYNEYFLPITFRYIPVLLVLILNIAIIVLLRRSLQFQHKASSKDSKREEDQRKITHMLLTVSIIYLICLLPGDFLLIASDIWEDFSFFGTYHNAFLALSDISLAFEVVNSSINFVVYMVLNRRFSETYKQLFCSRFSGLRRSGSSRSKSISKGTASTKETSGCASSVAPEGKQGMVEASTSGYEGSEDQVNNDIETAVVTHTGCDNPAYTN